MYYIHQSAGTISIRLLHSINTDHILSKLILSHIPENATTQHLVLTTVMTVILVSLNKSPSINHKITLKTHCFPLTEGTWQPHLQLVSENIDIINIAARYFFHWCFKPKKDESTIKGRKKSHKDSCARKRTIKRLRVSSLKSSD